ncbi:MAG: hypothetical protein CMD38_06375 [Flavobacteriales bacterium]|nr:hypothetical protein [Flavobacteriales bacterium]|tara:strand:+ start:4204 stop:5667 length:1464 start_codon:yes stop_codon:yes gene_type:complete
MGIIRKQSIHNSINLYVGIFIGAVNTILIYPFVFESNPEYWGLLQILVSYSVIFSSFSHLGAPSIFLRFFPKAQVKSELLSFTLSLCIIGFLLFALLFLFFKNSLLSFIDSSPLLQDHFYWVGVLVFALSFFDLFSSVSRSYLDSSTPVFLNEVFVRICVLVLLVLYHYDWIIFNQFLLSFISIYLIKLVILLFFQFKNRRLSFNMQFSMSNFKEHLKYGFYVITGGGAAILVSRFDMLMIEHYLDLKQVAYYGLAFFIGSVIIVPSRSVSSISSPLIAKSFEEKNFNNIQSIYSKSSINLLITGAVLFLCVLLNIDDILSMLPEKFSHGKIVVFFIGVSQLVNLVAGLHGLILIHSSYYKSIIYFNLFLLFITFITNFIFIPLYGINGAALATFISLLLFNAVRMIYVYKKMNFQPFSSKTAITFLMMLAIYFGLNYIPFTSMALLNIIIRSLIVCVLVAITVQYFKLSEDISNLLNSSFNKFFKK